MLKFQDDYTTLIATFEDFILFVYTIVDDGYLQNVRFRNHCPEYLWRPYRDGF